MGTARLVEDFWTCGKRWDLEGYLVDHGHRWPRRPCGQPMSGAEHVAFVLDWLDDRERPSGDLSDVTPAMLERRARWTGRAGLLYDGLVATGWIDVDGARRRWHDYYALNGRTIEDRVKHRRKRAGKGTGPGDGDGDGNGGRPPGTPPGDDHSGRDGGALGSGLWALGSGGALKEPPPRTGADAADSARAGDAPASPPQEPTQNPAALERERHAARIAAQQRLDAEQADDRRAWIAEGNTDDLGAYRRARLRLDTPATRHLRPQEPAMPATSQDAVQSAP